MKRILITGATGFVGAWLAWLYLENGYDVISIMHDKHPISSDKILGIHDKITWCYGDIIDTEFVERVIADYEVDEVIHGAAMPIERVSFRTITPVFRTNVMGTLSVLEAIKEIYDNGFSIKMLYLSSDKAYGDLGIVEYNEESLFNPSSIYSCSKSCADLTSVAFSKTFKIPISVVRPCNIYGACDLNSRVIPNTIRDCLEGNQPVIYTNINSVREYIYIIDVIQAIKLVLDNTKNNFGEVYNIGSGETKTQRECVDEILKYFDIKPIYKEAPSFTEKEIKFQKLNSEKIKLNLKWKSLVSFEQGIKWTVEDWNKYSQLQKGN